MTGPGGDEVGRVSIRVVPNTDGFRRQLQRELAAIERSLKLKIPVELGDIDTAGLKAQLAALEQSRVTIPVDIGDGTEIERLRARLQALDNARVNIPVDLDVRDLERADAVLRRLDGRSIRMNVRLNGVRQAIRDLTALDAIVRRLDGRRISIGVDVDAGAAIAQIAAIEAALVGVRASLGAVGSGGGGFGRGSAVLSGMAQFVGLLLQASALAVGLSVAGAAVTAAWGAVSTAILAIPPALLLLAAPIGAIAAGMDGIKAAAKTIKPEFEALQKAVSATFERHMIPVFRTLLKLFPTLQTGLQNSARAVSFLAQSMTNMLTSAPGLALIGKTFENINFALLQMHPGLESVVQGFLLLGSQTSIFDALVKAVNTFGEEFRNSVIDVITDGTLDRAMSGLGESLAALSRGFMSLVENGLRAFAAAAPGVNKFLDSLTNFFNRFNWDSLGSSVGRVFEGLGETLDGIDTQTIRDIEQAFSDLGDLFNDPKFQGQLQEMVAAIPEAIGLVKDLSKAFGEVGSDIAKAIEAYDKIKTAVTDVNAGIKDLTGGLDLLKTAWNALPFNALPNFISTLLDFFSGDEAGKSAEESGAKVREGWERGLRGGGGSFGPKTGSFGDWLPDLGQMFRDLFGPAATSLDTLMTDLQIKIRDGLTPLAETARLAMEQVRLAVQTGLTQLLPVVTLGLVGVQTAFTNSFLAIGAAVSLGMNTLVNTLTLGFVLMQTAVANGMLLLQTAFTTGWALIQLAVDNGLLLMRTAVTEGFLQMQTDATNGMLLFAAAVLAGFALVVPAVTVGMAQIVLAVQLGFQQIVTAVQTGMQQVTEALQLNWSAAVAATETAMGQMEVAVQIGMSNIGVYVQDGMQRAVDAVTAGMDLMSDEVARGMSDAEAAVKQGIARMLSALHSAVGQFRAAGAAMGQGLVDGLNSKLGAVQAAAARLAAAAASALRAAAAIRSPSKVFIGFGEMMGVGLALGMHRSESEVERAARSLASSVIDSMSGVQDVLAADAWAADFNARVNAELSAHDAVDTGSAGKQVTIHTEIHNPLPETGSDSVAQTHRRQAALGLFG